MTPLPSVPTSPEPCRNTSVGYGPPSGLYDLGRNRTYVIRKLFGLPSSPRTEPVNRSL